MSSNTPNLPKSAQHDTRPVATGGRASTGFHESVASPTFLAPETPDQEAIDEVPQVLRQDSVHIAHLPLGGQSHGSPPASPQGKPPKPISDTSIESQPTPKQMSALRIRLWIAFCVAFFVLAPVVSILLGVNLHVKDMQYVEAERPDFPGRTIAFEVILVAADPKHGILRLDWKIIEETNSACSADNLNACTSVNIFFDTNLLRPEGTFSTQEAIMTSDRSQRPLFVFNAAGFAGKDIRAQRPIFRTQLALFSEGEHPSSLLYYPFDRYTSELVFFAEDVSTNATVGVKVKRTGGVAVGFEAIVSHKTDRIVPPEVVEAIITLGRSTLVKSYSVVATVAIWVVTIILALVMITSVFFGFKQRPEVLLIPVATLFAFTTLRQSMPGAPEGFGDIIDLVGLVPCLALLALTAALSLGVFLVSDPGATTRTLRWKNMYEAFPMLMRKGTGENKV